MDTPSCRSIKANAVRLQLHALAYDMANFFRTLILPDETERRCDHSKSPCVEP
jgi:hypothetical protein